MGIKAEAENDVDDFLEEEGELVGLLPADGPNRSIYMVISTPGETEIPDFAVARDHREAECFCDSRNDTTGRINLKAFGELGAGGDRFTYQGKTWYVLEVLERNQGGMHRFIAGDKCIPRQ